ncbi:MAG: carbon-nitrogen hydrolase family protein [Nocardioidaceae bacterium]
MGASLEPLRVAAVQAVSVAGDVEANVASTVQWVGEAALAGARLLVFPELFLSGYDPATLRERPDDCDLTRDDDRLTPLVKAVRSAGVTAVVGASLRSHDGRRSLSVLTIAADGRVEAAYDKQHLWDEERAIFTAGVDGASLQLGSWNLGLGICYDGCFPEHARAATDAGALVYVCPSAYLVGSEHRRDLYYAARAIDNAVYVVFAGLVGQCGELEFSGGTAVYDPQGRRVTGVVDDEGLVVADLEPAKIDEARRINPYDHDRPATLGGRRVITV